MSITMVNADKERMKAILKEELKYIDYIDEHVENVMKAYEKLFDGKDIILPKEVETEGEDDYTIAESKRIIQEVRKYVEAHDNSKYSDDEFYGYRRKYNPTEFEKHELDEEEIKRIDEEAQEAWYHHFTSNPHHPKFWAYCKIHSRDGFGEPIDWEPFGKSLDIPEPMSMVSIIHMICDWEAMSMKFNGNTIDWYIDKAKDERSYMNPYTRKVVEILLERVYNTTLPSKEEIDKKDNEEGK